MALGLGVSKQQSLGIPKPKRIDKPITLIMLCYFLEEFEGDFLVSHQVLWLLFVYILGSASVNLITK
jgi:hypothetical protein